MYPATDSGWVQRVHLFKEGIYMWRAFWIIVIVLLAAVVAAMLTVIILVLEGAL